MHEVRGSFTARGTMLAAFALAAMLAVGAGSRAQADHPSQEALVTFGTQIATLINSHTSEATRLQVAESLAAMFVADDITCPGPEPTATATVCEGQASGTVVQGYWAGALNSEGGVVTADGIRRELDLALERLPTPARLATTASRAVFPFLRERCADCAAVVLAGAVPPGGGQPTLIFSVKATPQGLKAFSATRGSILQPDEQVYVSGGTHRDGTHFVGIEPPFNYDIVREVVVPLIGDDGRTHYVTLSEDTAGVVRVRLSLFNFRGLGFNIVLFRRGNCSASADWGPDDVILPNFPLELDPQAATTLVLHFFNTTSITLTPGPRSIYDADGTFLAVYRPGSGGSGLLAACAALASPPGAPGTGTGAASPSDEMNAVSRLAVVATGLSLAAAAGLMALGYRRRRGPGCSTTPPPA